MMDEGHLRSTHERRVTASVPLPESLVSRMGGGEGFTLNCSFSDLHQLLEIQISGRELRIPLSWWKTARGIAIREGLHTVRKNYLHTSKVQILSVLIPPPTQKQWQLWVVMDAFIRFWSLHNIHQIITLYALDIYLFMCQWNTFLEPRTKMYL